VLENCGGELVRRLVAMSWFLDVQQILAVIFYKSTYLPKKKLRIFLRFVIIQRTLRKELSQCRWWRSGLTNLQVLLVTDYMKRTTARVWPPMAECSDSGSRIFVE
jgi:hypothetical protein